MQIDIIYVKIIFDAFECSGDSAASAVFATAIIVIAVVDVVIVVVVVIACADVVIIFELDAFRFVPTILEPNLDLSFVFFSVKKFTQIEGNRKKRYSLGCR